MALPKRKIWEFQGPTVCRILGLAFNEKEQEKVFKKLKLGNGKQLPSAPEIHGCLVQSCTDSNLTSKYLDKMLEKRFELYQKRVEALNQKDICALIERGNTENGFRDVPLQALIWFAARNQDEEVDEIETRVFNAVHLREHRALRFYDSLCRMLPDGRAENVIQELKKALASKEELQRRYEKLERKKEQLRLEIEELKKGKSQLALLLAEQERVSEKLKWDLEKLDGESALEQVEGLKKEVEFLTKEIGILTEELLKRELNGVPVRADETLVYQRDDAEDELPQDSGIEDEEDISPSLDGRKVAFVGGLDSLVPYYKQAVECLGGTFCAHRGKWSQGKGDIEKIVDKADVIFCPVDINSHYACRNVKKTCKLMDKPCYFLRSSSLSMFRKELINSIWDKDGIETQF